jgi:hypothetical protein
MKRRGPIVLALTAVLAAAPAAVAAPKSAPLVISGLGGQSAVLTAPSGGLDVEYPFFTEPRLPGPDGAVGGVIFQRVGDARLAAGVILQNAPGFDRAIAIPLLDWDHTVLPAGRYRVTLLGKGRQIVHLAVRRTTKSRRLAAHGSSRPISRVVASTASLAGAWSDKLGRIGSGDYLVIGAGSGGDFQQASENSLCLQREASAEPPCVPGSGFMLAPGAGASGSWASYLYRPGSIEPGSYVFSGNAVGLGPSSTTGHSAVVISLPR